MDPSKYLRVANFHEGIIELKWTELGKRVGATPFPFLPRKVRITEIDEVADKCLNGVRVERNGYFRTIKPTWPYLLRLFPRFSDTIRKSPSSIYQLLSATFTAPERVVRSGCSDLSCDPFNPNPLFKQSLLSFCKQYLNYVDNYGKEYSSRNLLVPKENLQGRISFDYSPDFRMLFVNLHRVFTSYYLLRSQRPNESFVADTLI